jgi:hypothetical protein
MKPTYESLEQSPRKQCVICADPVRRDFVASLHLKGYAYNRIERLSREDPNVPGMKRETISRHFTQCLGIETRDKYVQRSMQRSLDRRDDVATLVQQEVVAKLRAGEARVTVQHGLQAQALLDRRDERAKDRELAINLARILHIAPPPTHLVSPHEVIEGDYERVPDEAHVTEEVDPYLLSAGMGLDVGR